MAVRASIRGLIARYLGELGLARVGPREWEALLTRLGQEVGDARRVHPHYVLEVLHETQVEVDRSLGGLPLDLRGRVHTGGDEAAESLLAMSSEYAMARAAGDATRAEDVRRAVRQAKDRLRLVSRRRNLKAETRKEKERLLEWFLVWLENPTVFPAWLAVRRSQDAGKR